MINRGSISHLFTAFLLIAVIHPTPSLAHNSERLLGGHDAEDGLASYQVSIQTLPGNHMCGGAIIADRWILTAGHCVSGWPSENLRVATGSNLYTEPRAVYYPDETYLHCNFNNPQYEHDIALVHVKETIVFDERTKPIALPAMLPQLDEELLLTGWGTTVLWGEIPERLQKLQLNLITRERCDEMLKPFDDISADISRLCTFTREGEGSCHGDSGGPLVANNGTTLVGVINWYYQCGQGVPDVYANVIYYRDWIRQVMSGNGKCKSVQRENFN